MNIFNIISKFITGNFEVRGVLTTTLAQTAPATLEYLTSGYVDNTYIKILKCTAGTNLVKGNLVYSNVWDTTNIQPTVGLADNSSLTTLPCLGVANNTFNNGSTIAKIVNNGLIIGVDTSAFNMGDILFVGVNGGYTNVKPINAQPIGVVMKSGFADGVIFVNLGIDIGQYPGIIYGYGGTTAPYRHLMCDGAAISRTTYAALFATIGTAYGAGNGTTTFNVPDMRQRFPLGKASTSGSTGFVLGSTGGAIDHFHVVDPPNTTTTGPTGLVAATILAGGAASTTHTHDINIPAFNSATANPPYQVVNYIITY